MSGAALWVDILVGMAVGILVTWLILVGCLVLVRPKGNLLTEAVRLLPDLLRLLPRLAGDRSLPRGVRIRLWLLLGYLSIPLDLVPDFIPILGYADDAIIVVAVLRSVVHRAGPESLTRHWPGRPDGLAAVRKLARVPDENTP